MFFTAGKVFTATAQSGQSELLPRALSIDGTRLLFAIPEDFSKDMPADDLIENSHTLSPQLAHPNDSRLLMRRWWTLKEPGLFQRQRGSLVMSIALVKKPESQGRLLKTQAYDLGSLLDFTIALYDSLKLRWADHNASVIAGSLDPFYMHVSSLLGSIGDEFYSGFDKLIINGHPWVRTEIAQQRPFHKVFATPVADDVFLEIQFGVLANDNTNAYRFSGLAMKRVNRILQTLIIEQDNNPLVDRVQHEWKEEAILQVLTAPGVPWSAQVQRVIDKMP